MLAGVVGVIVILAIVLPMSTANSGEERNSKNNMSAAGAENSENDGDFGRDTDNNAAGGAPLLNGDEGEGGEGEGEGAAGEGAGEGQIGVSATCPCFNAQDLDKASTDIASGSYTFYPETTCKGKDSASATNSITYTNDEMGYPAMLGYEVTIGECRKSDMIFMASAPEEAACRSLLNDKCTEHSSVFAAAAAVADESATCPCFDTEDLDKAAEDVASGSYTFKSASTCTGSDSGSNGIVYTNDSRGYPMMMGCEVRTNSCRKSDTFRETSASENSACRSLITSKCVEHSSIFAAAAAAAAANTNE